MNGSSTKSYHNSSLATNIFSFGDKFLGKFLIRSNVFKIEYITISI